MNNKEQLASIPTIAKELNHDRTWVELRLTEFKIEPIRITKNQHQKYYDISVIDFLKKNQYMKKKKPLGCKMKLNENSLSPAEIGRRIGKSSWWVRHRIENLNIKSNGTFNGHPSYDPSIIENLFSLDEEMFNKQHRKRTEEECKQQGERTKTFFWKDRENILNKKRNTKENKIKDFSKNHTSVLELMNKNDWGRIGLLKVCESNDINIIHKHQLIWIENKDLNKLYELMKDYNNHTFSMEEKSLCDFVKSLVDDVIENDRKILNGKELDIYIPSKNVAIEYDGLLYHSTYYKDKKICKEYHLNKTKLCEEKGIRLIHIFSDEWLYKTEIVKSLISSSLGIYSEKIFARKCEVREINNENACKFLEQNHIQGKINGKHLGLFYNNELVQLISYGKNRFKKNEIELYRMCTKLNTQVLGGFSKLISHLNVDEIHSYIDRRLFNGNGYNSCGWEIEGYSKPSYFYTRSNYRYNRVLFQKHKLKNKLEFYDENKTEFENMEDNGFYRIYDCGTIKVVWRK